MVTRICPSQWQFLSATIIVKSFTSIDMFTAQRHMQFGRVTFFEVSSQIVTVIIVIVWAWIDPSIWALAGGTFVGGVFEVILSHILFPSKANRFGWDRESALELFHFGKWLILSSTLGFIYLFGDRIILGFLLTTSDLGRYSIASELVGAAKHAVGGLNWSVWMSSMSQTFQKNRELVVDSYYQIRKYQDAALLFSSGLLFSMGDIIIQVLYDERYADAGWMLQVLSLSLAFMVFTLKGPFMLVEGNSKQYSFMVFLNAMAMIIGVPICFALFDSIGAVFMVSSVALFGYPAGLYYFHKRNYLVLYKEFMFLPLFVLGVVVGWLISLMPLWQALAEFTEFR